MACDKETTDGRIADRPVRSGGVLAEAEGSEPRAQAVLHSPAWLAPDDKIDVEVAVEQEVKMEEATWRSM